ncbi:TPA: 3-deoxy-7-phosphoheptulonate synthase [Candidatus Poribacteria bacterium]|nr:3-deoxy-7-phosphoheptulonate synthase [Candidatus Poribacteria bacterium]
MVIVMKPGATREQIEHVAERIRSYGLRPHISVGEERVLIGAIGDESPIRNLPWEAMPGVDRAVPIMVPYKLVSRQFKSENTIIKLDDVEIGGEEIVVMAGPCAVETEEQILKIARAVASSGAKILRGGAFKPRTAPYSFQGLGEEGLKLLDIARRETGLKIITEVMSDRDVELVYEYADILQIGTRNMQNFSLLKEIGKIDKPVLLKRGMSATIEDWLLAAEYIVLGGNHKVILCERGIRTFETYTRNTLDLSAVPVAKDLSHLPVIVDPSHGTGRRELVIPMAKAALAAGANGLLIEVHHDPENSWTGDGRQSLLPDQFDLLMKELKPLANVLGRRVGG